MVTALKGSITLRTASQAFLFGLHGLDLGAGKKAGVPVNERRKGWAWGRLKAAVEHWMVGVGCHGCRRARVERGAAVSLYVARLDKQGYDSARELRFGGFRQRLGLGVLSLPSPACRGREKQSCQKNSQAGVARPASRAGASHYAVFCQAALQRVGPRLLQVVLLTHSSKNRASQVSRLQR